MSWRKIAGYMLFMPLCVLLGLSFTALLAGTILKAAGFLLCFDTKMAKKEVRGLKLIKYLL